MENVNKSNKNIWILVTRFDLAGENENPKQTLHPLLLPTEGNSKVIIQHISESLGLLDETLVFKLRNHRGSLVPVNCNITPNSSKVPYHLEVVRRYQNVQPEQRSMKNPKYNEALKNTLQNFIKRIELLEEALPKLSDARRAKLQQEMEDCDGKLNFLNKRLEEADHSQWKGMFKKPPLW